MNDLNQIYVSYLIEQKLRRDHNPAREHVASAFEMSRLNQDGPSPISRIIGSLRHRSFGRRRDIAVTTLNGAKGTGGIS